MQGGEIGVKSEPGKGSTFQFYGMFFRFNHPSTRMSQKKQETKNKLMIISVKTRRTTPSPNTVLSSNVQLMIREDSLQEACGASAPAWNDTIKKDQVLEGGTLSPVLLTPQSLHILVVEDNLVNQRVVSKQLQKEGHVVHVANHGGEALDFIRKSIFWHANSAYFGERLNVVLLDLEMPVMNGLTCIKKIRELQMSGEIVRHIPVIAVTANARSDQIKKCYDAGMVSGFQACGVR